jgi:effector-binding domain-containing protein
MKAAGVTGEKPRNGVDIHHVAPRFMVALQLSGGAEGPSLRSETAIEQIELYLATIGISPSDYPIVVRHDLSLAPVDPADVPPVEVGVPIALPLPVDPPLKLVLLPGGLAARIVHTGSRTQTEPVYGAIVEWADVNERELVGSPWEVRVEPPSGANRSVVGRIEVYWLVRQN